MKSVLLLSLIFSFSTLANDQLKHQLTNPDYIGKPSGDLAAHEPSGVQTIKLVKQACDTAAEHRAKLQKHRGTPKFKEVLQEVFKWDKRCGVSTKVNENGEVVGISLTNDTANKMNSRTESQRSNRQYNFEFEGRSKQDARLKITDDSAISGRMSHDLLETTIIFVPRKVLPYVEIDHKSAFCARRVYLPTDEYVVFDALTKEIIAGVLKERPMDKNKSRHKRKFAGIEYTGNGIMIRADRRAGTPEHTYKTAYNTNEKINKATITRKGKTCYVAKSKIWANTNKPNKGAYFKYETDQEFLDAVINPICGWGLSLSDIQ